MAHSINHKQTLRGFFLIAAGIAVGYATSAGANQQGQPGTLNSELRYHQTIKPAFNPTVGENPCQDEIDAYVLALSVVEAANAQADAAYMAWMECSSMGKAKSAAEQLNDAPSNSVLIRD